MTTVFTTFAYKWIGLINIYRLIDQNASFFFFFCWRYSTILRALSESLITPPCLISQEKYRDSFKCNNVTPSGVRTNNFTIHYITMSKTLLLPLIITMIYQIPMNDFFYHSYDPILPKWRRSLQCDVTMFQPLWGKDELYSCMVEQCPLAGRI